MKLLGITDLAKRWNYTRQGVHLKMQQCASFPRPIATINKNILVFDEDAIVAFEQTRKELTDAKYKHWYTHRRWLYKEEEVPASFFMPKHTGFSERVYKSPK